MTIFFDNGLSRNPDFGNTPVWDLPNIWRLGRVVVQVIEVMEKISNKFIFIYEKISCAQKHSQAKKQLIKQK